MATRSRGEFAKFIPQTPVIGGEACSGGTPRPDHLLVLGHPGQIVPLPTRRSVRWPLPQSPRFGARVIWCLATAPRGYGADVVKSSLMVIVSTHRSFGQSVVMNRHHGVLLLAVVLLASCNTLGDSKTTSDVNSQSPVWESLQQRPLKLTKVSASEPCPRSPSRQLTDAFAAGLGSGPLFPVGGNTIAREHRPADGVEDGWAYVKVLWVSPPHERGPYLVRGVRLDAPGEVRFNKGLDRELRLSAGGTATTPGTDWVQWPSYIRVASPGCYGFQVESRDESHPVIFEVT